MNTGIYKRICSFVRDKIAGTKWEGHVFTVGGCCRDMVLGSEINDVDFAVDLPGGGIEFAEWLHANRLTIGRPVKFEKYGTAMTRLRAFPKEEIEIVQTRAEKYTDRNSRNPETAFGSLKDDCFRRDLTINALYYDISHDRVIDITGQGIPDIQNHIIRTPADPDCTFDDDPIRILRTARFATRLGWTLPEYIFEAMQRNVDRLTIIKPERMRSEFEKILLSEHPDEALIVLRKCGALSYIMPPLEQLWVHSPLPWETMLTTLRHVKEKDLTLRLAALLAPYSLIPGIAPQGVQELIVKSLLSLKYHSPMIREVCMLARLWRFTADWGTHAENMTDADLRKLQYSCAKPDRLDMLLKLIDASQRMTMPRQVKAIRMRMTEMTKAGTEMYHYHLPFAERRIKKLLSIPPGPLVDDTLRYMMELAFENPSRSKTDYERLVSQYNPQPLQLTFENELLIPDFNGPRNNSGLPVTPSSSRSHKSHRSSRNGSRRSNYHHRRRSRPNKDKK